MQISQEEFERIFNAISFTITRLYYVTTGNEPTAAFVTTMTRRMGVDYLDEIGVSEVAE